MCSRTLILGLGNPLYGDDGIGPRVIADLGARRLPDAVTVCDGGTCGLELVQFLADWERVLIVDAADVGQKPGGFVRFSTAEARVIARDGALSVHAAGLGEAIALAEALGRSLPEIIVFGVQPAELEWRDGLSAPVEAGLPALVDAVLEEVQGDDSAQDSRD